MDPTEADGPLECWAEYGGGGIPTGGGAGTEGRDDRAGVVDMTAEAKGLVLFVGGWGGADGGWDCTTYWGGTGGGAIDGRGLDAGNEGGTLTGKGGADTGCILGIDGAAVLSVPNPRISAIPYISIPDNAR